MKIYLTLFLLIFLNCQKKSTLDKNNTLNSSKIDSFKTSNKNNLKSEDKIIDSVYNCDSKNYMSILEEILNQNSEAYKLTITSKNGKNKMVKLLNVRPKISQINYCNDLYTVVGFPCGGPCYSQVFVFTDKNRPNEQYTYSQKIKNVPNLIAHIKDEKFEKLIIHNFFNSKELIVDISDSNSFNYGQMDSMFVNKDKLLLYYLSNKNKSVFKTVNIKAIL